MAAQSVDDVRSALDGIASGLRYDGYELEVVAAAETLRVRIVALPDACEDCLAPAGVFAGIISGALDGAYSPDQIELEYPAGSAAH